MVSMEGKIHSGLFAQERYILGGVPIKLKLVRTSAAFSLVSSADPATYKVVIEDCVFRVRRVNVSSTVMIGHTEGILRNPDRTRTRTWTRTRRKPGLRKNPDSCSD